MQNISFGRMFVISLLGFALTFSSNIQDPPLMTFKVRQLAPDLPNTALGFLGFVGLLVAMVVQPIVGVLSDRARTKLGRRLPFIIGGAVLIAFSLFLLAAAPALWILLLGVILIQFSSNILQGPWQALIPDLVPEHQRGTASSLKAVMDIVALVVGGMVAGKILSAGIERFGNNGVYLAAAAPTVVFFVFVILTAIWAREGTEAGFGPAPTAQKTVGEALKGAFYVNFRENKTFGWWFANRILFWGAFIAINSFLINYLVDVIKMTETEAQAFYGNLKVILGGALIVLALLSGWLSDKFGRKPVMLIAGLVAFAGAFALLFVRERTLITVAGGVVGMGIGAFLSASWALATDIVPRDETARYLGIANIATCIGSGTARLLGGVFIDPINQVLGSDSSGYLFLFALATVSFLASALVILPLPNRKQTSTFGGETL
ncbi:MAG: MFS transporter [Anaerolineales bacterium]|nr:MFS transporter [Anaerolineales bacterium]MDW8226628.1 MFS transporter [Anaerolineales bacterium]